MSVAYFPGALSTACRVGADRIDRVAGSIVSPLADERIAFPIFSDAPGHDPAVAHAVVVAGAVAELEQVILQTITAWLPNDHGV